jgi:hypothetical protein
MALVSNNTESLRVHNKIAVIENCWNGFAMYVTDGVGNRIAAGHIT